MSGPFTFAQVPVADIPRSSFNRSHGYKTTFNAGYLIPIYVDEALPGDTFHLKLDAFARLATPLVPIMDNLHMDFFFFAVPNRLVWEHWQAFMGERPTPTDTTEYNVPVINFDAGGAAPLSIYDYMGIPTGKVLSINALPLRAYNLIWNEWFRDQNLQEPQKVPVDDGPDSYGWYDLRKRGKRHDYFTSCLPWPQKGPGVEIPIAGTAPVIPSSGAAMPTFWWDGFTQGTQGLIPAGSSGSTRSVQINESKANAASDPGQRLLWGEPNLMADLSNATAITINELRLAFQWQKLQERDARGGTRYTEILRAHFGVVSPDARLQRPEYLGGGSVPVVINPVSQTSGSPTQTPNPVGGDTPQGTLAGYGVAGARNLGFSKSFVEHSYVIGLVMVRADLSYQYGLHKMWSRKTKLEFYWPALSNIGEQDVKMREIFAQGNAQDDTVFGYQERWAEYRYFPSLITGKFRSSDPQSLDYWHLAQKWDTAPVLGDTFISENPPVDRVVAVPSEPQFIFDSHFSIRCVRPMPTYSVPGYIDHF